MPNFLFTFTLHVNLQRPVGGCPVAVFSTTTPYANFLRDFLTLYAPHIFPKVKAQHLTKIKKYVII